MKGGPSTSDPRDEKEKERNHFLGTSSALSSVATSSGGVSYRTGRGGWLASDELYLPYNIHILCVLLRLWVLHTVTVLHIVLRIPRDLYLGGRRKVTETIDLRHGGSGSKTTNTDRHSHPFTLPSPTSYHPYFLPPDSKPQ